jgi:hypothetical protein
VVGTGPQKGKPECEVHTLVKLQCLERSEALIVVKRDNDIELPLQVAVENGVARQAM